MPLCDYGCGKEATHQFKNGKWCCSKSYKKCRGVIEKVRNSLIGNIPWNKNKKGLQVAWNKNKKLGSQSKELVEKRIRSLRGRKRSPFSEEWKKNLGSSNRGRKDSEITKKKKSESNKGKHSLPCSEETKQKLRLAHKGQKISEKCKEINRIRMSGEEGNEIRKKIKNPSEPELRLREIIQELYPTSEHTYKVLKSKGYEVDNALLGYKIVIEYDGYYHFDTEEHKQYHSKRQEEIEQEGWRFLRYNIFQKFPTKEQIREDIQKVLEEINQCHSFNL